MPERSGAPGPLIIIGGGEDREGERVILRTFAEAVNGGRAVLATIASEHPDGYVETSRTTIAVSSSIPIPSTRGLCATAPSSRPKRPRSAKC